MPRPLKPVTAEDAIQQRRHLAKHYQRTRKEYRDALFQQPGGEQLQEFARQLARYGRTDATAMLRFVRETARGWLATAEPQFRTEALSLCNERIIAIRVRAGLEPFDDPLPGDERTQNDVWQQCKQELT